MLSAFRGSGASTILCFSTFHFRCSLLLFFASASITLADTSVPVISLSGNLCSSSSSRMPPPEPMSTIEFPISHVDHCRRFAVRREGVSSLFPAFPVLCRNAFRGLRPLEDGPCQSVQRIRLRQDLVEDVEGSQDAAEDFVCFALLRGTGSFGTGGLCFGRHQDQKPRMRFHSLRLHRSVLFKVFSAVH